MEIIHGKSLGGNEDNYLILRNAIIMQAVDDFNTASKYLHKIAKNNYQPNPKMLDKCIKNTENEKVLM